MFLLGVPILYGTLFMCILRKENVERRNERKETGDWSWLIPPVSPAAMHIFHKPYDNEIVKPNYFYQDPPYAFDHTSFKRLDEPVQKR